MERQENTMVDNKPEKFKEDIALPKLEIKNVTKKYKEVMALDDFSVTLTPGIYGLLGPNGAGKSTLMKCIADIIRPTSGEILFNGESIYKLSDKFRAELGFMPQEIGFYPSFTGVQIMKYFSSLKGVKLTKQQIDESLDRVNLSSAKNKKVGGYSGGMKRRLGIAVTLMNMPSVMIFDEPTAGLDPEERMRFKKNLLELAKDNIIILATHIISDIESLCDKILFIKQGKLIKVEEGVRGNSENLMQSELEAAYLDVFGEKGAEHE